MGVHIHSKHCLYHYNVNILIILLTNSFIIVFVFSFFAGSQEIMAFQHKQGSKEYQVTQRSFPQYSANEVVCR